MRYTRRQIGHYIALERGGGSPNMKMSPYLQIVQKTVNFKNVLPLNH